MTRFMANDLESDSNSEIRLRKSGFRSVKNFFLILGVSDEKRFENEGNPCAISKYSAGSSRIMFNSSKMSLRTVSGSTLVL